MYWCVCLFIYLQENKGIKLLKMLKKASLDPMGEVFSLLDWLDTVMTEWHMYVKIYVYTSACMNYNFTCQVQSNYLS